MACGTAEFAKELARRAEDKAKRIEESAVITDSVSWDLNNKVLQKRCGQDFVYLFGFDTPAVPEEGFFDGDAHHIRLHQHNKNLGGVVWTAAIQVSKYLEWNCHQMALDGARVVELGSGTGLVGFVAAHLGAQVTVTDLPDVLPSLEDNARLNPPVATVAPLRWGERADTDALPSGWDWIIGSDLIHCDEVVDPLLATLRMLTETTPAPRVLLGGDERGRVGAKRFWAEASDLFTIETVPAESIPAKYRYCHLYLVIMTRKQQ